MESLKEYDLKGSENN